ncbi:biotin carboxylase N-terminal domain-containing protein [Nocardioides speluncae]|uniref:ATP-binding protein n=1 Tax=Nocardioides speluncae TaxID=2670337 RepID=UPI000D68BC4E|nr:biotin carboxylase N-terminal domain-containing protein [Nocardioides speluncae]
MTTSKHLASILVANRGEIARRVFRTARDLGLSTVALYSDADEASPHVTEADAAVHLPGNAPSDTYLRSDLVIEAALRAGADAIHPGYGFLSENAAFARAVEAAGLTWIGPPPESIDSMGSKIESKRLMAAAGVPVLTELDPAQVTEADLPVLIKASAGGGGRGMRIVRHLADIEQEAELARAEAASAFGDPTVFCEPYLATGRHIEVQIMADQHGTVWAVGERECSIQRRHQKVVEEAPSPLVERIDGMREKLFEASRAAASAIGYTGAGTVEFLADESGKFFFLEMNTRLQVEHPVTECTTGLDLVALQVLVANGGRLDPEPPPSVGHSIEVRLYAEDPAANWQPQSGLVHAFEVPGVRSTFDLLPAGIRLDSGIESGSLVGIHYDPMLAKVISYAPTRDEASLRLAAALERTKLHGLVTNRDLLVRVLRHEAFLAGDTDTAFFDRHGLDVLSEPLADKDTVALSALAAALADAASNRASARVQGGLPSGWRSVTSQPIRKRYLAGDDELEVAYALTRSGLAAEGYEDVSLVSSTPSQVVLTVDGVRRTFDVAAYGDVVAVDSPLGAVALKTVARYPDPLGSAAPGSLLAPMPGSVVRIAAKVGDTVTEGQALLWLEAMKMQHQISAPTDGVVSELPVQEGQQVDLGAVLAVVTTHEEENS